MLVGNRMYQSAKHKLRPFSETLKAAPGPSSPHGRLRPRLGSFPECTAIDLIKLQVPPQAQILILLQGTLILHTMPRDFVAQVWVTPESWWNSGLDQSESQIPNTVSSPGRGPSCGEKDEVTSFFSSSIHSLTHTMSHAFISS